MEFDILSARTRSFKIFDPVNGLEVGTFHTNGRHSLEIQNRYYDRILAIMKAGMVALDEAPDAELLPSDQD